MLGSVRMLGYPLATSGEDTRLNAADLPSPLPLPCRLTPPRAARMAPPNGGRDLEDLAHRGVSIGSFGKSSMPCN